VHRIHVPHNGIILTCNYPWTCAELWRW